MYRSFTDRVLGGVCGGLGAAWRINPWILRTAFVLFTLASLGVGILFYLALWWALPMESLLEDHRASVFNLLLVLVILLVMVGGWIGQVTGQLRGPNGQQLFLPLALMTLSAVFFLRQFGRRA